MLQTKFQVLPVAYGSPTMGKYVYCKAWFTLCLPKTALQPCFLTFAVESLTFNCHDKHKMFIRKTNYFCYCLRQVQTFEVQTKSTKLLKSSAVYCVSLQKIFCFLTQFLRLHSMTRKGSAMYNRQSTLLINILKKIALKCIFARYP